MSPEPPEIRERSRARRLLPWLLAAALAGYLCYRIPLEQLNAALAQGRWGYLIAIALFVDLGALFADSWATAKVYSWFLAPVRWRELIPIRGATYLMAILNYYVGQAGLLFYVYRTKQVSLSAAAGLMLMMLGMLVLVLAGLSAFGVALLADEPSRRLSWLLLALGLGALLYFSLLQLKPGWLQGRDLLTPLFAAGILGHLRAGLVRIPHVAILVATHYLAMRCFGIRLPLGAALGLIPLTLLVGCLPFTPFGLGTTQLVAVHLFARFAPARGAAGEALVLAYSLSLSSLALAFQGVIGLLFLRYALNMPGARRAADGEAQRP